MPGVTKLGELSEGLGLKLCYEAQEGTLEQNEDGTFAIKKDGKERIVTETQLLDECRKAGWLAMCVSLLGQW